MLRLLALVLLAFLSLACSEPAKPQNAARANEARTVVLVTVEAWRGDSDPGPAFKDARVTYADAATVVPMTRPALAAILTGRGADRLQVRDNFGDTLPKDAKTIGGAFRGAGWATAAFVASPAASYGSSLERDFALFDGPEDLVVGPGRFYPRVRPATEVVGNFATWLRGAPKNSGVFAWVHLADASGAATTGTLDEAKAAYATALGAIASGLSGVERALVDSGRLGAALVLVVGTHGTLLGEDGARGSSYWLRPETLHVPLLVAGSSARDRFVAAGRTVSILDVAPTLAAAGGVGPLEGVEGSDLAAPLPQARTRIAWTWAPDDENAWPTLSATESTEGWRVLAWPESKTMPRPAMPRERRLRPETIDRLRKAGVPIDVAKDDPSPAVPDVAAFWQVIAEARHLLANDRYRAALKILADYEAQHPGTLVVGTHRVYILSTGGASPRLKGISDELLKRYPMRPEVLHWAGHAAFAAKDTERAEALVLASAEIGPADADHYYDLACARSLAGDVTASIDYLGKAINAGYRNWEWMGKDTDLANARADARFAQLLRSHGR
jgi:hypothetical protein